MEQSSKENGLIQRVPEECLTTVIGLTSPADACRSAVVSAGFRSAADSDAVWERFLPLDCDAVLERAVHFVDSSSRKELFMDLSDEHVLLDDGKRSFGLQRSSGAKCYMLSVREMAIAWVKIDLYWRERSDPDSRFSMVAELMSVCWLSISGHISTKELSPGTHYAAYLVFKLTHDASGLASPQQRSVLSVGGRQGSTHTASLHPCNRTDSSCTGEMADGEPHDHERDDGVVVRYPRPRVDGWLELEMGDFHTGDSDDEATAAEDVDMILHECEELQWKKGLIIEGIEIRPKKIN
ncbi:putative F-box protein PP2-B12 isoform X2 [Triticum dicoccoides]|uniref:putative F-box protein PP2-B12 isoform X2 n=1 Tax=Triticum dicoccoides TaxID=85692 RepID=UPI0018910A53|nr:putative F-box protein PP2-B12 isoform X2 [Triticum dicoccoides]